MHTTPNIIKHAHAKILVGALERQVSWGDTTMLGVVGH